MEVYRQCDRRRCRPVKRGNSTLQFHLVGPGLWFSANYGVDFTDRRPESYFFFFNQNREESFRPLHSAGVVFAEPFTVAVAN